MALEVGSTVARLGAELDDRGFDAFERRLQRAVTQAHKGAVAELRGDLDDRGFDRYNRRLDDTERRTGTFAGRMRGHFGAAGASVVGFGAGAAGIAGVGAAMLGVVRAGATFERNMSEVKAVSGATADQMDALSDAARTMGTETGLGAGKAAQAVGELAKGGLTAQQIIGGGLKGALALASAGGLELADAATGISDAINLFNLNGSDATHVADAFATAANATTADVGDFTLALSQGGSAAKAAGLSFDSTTVALEALAANGVKGSDAGTSLKSALTQIANPTKQAREEMERLGLSFFDSHGRMKDVDDISAMLRDKLGGLTKQQRLQAASTVAGTDGMRALLALYDTGPRRLGQFEDGLRKQGTAADVAKEKNNNLQGAAKRMIAELENGAITIYKRVEPALRDAADAVTKFVHQMQTGEGAGGRFVDALKTIGGVIGDVVGAIVDLVNHFREHRTQADLLITVLGGLAGGFVALRVAMAAVAGMQRVVAMFQLMRGVFIAARAGALGYMAAQYGVNAAILANPIGLIIVALAAMGAAFVIAWKRSATFRAIVRDAFDAVRHVVLVAGGQVLKFVDVFLGAVSSIAGVASHLPGVGDKFKGVQQAVDHAREGLRKYRDELHETDKQHQRMGHIRDLAEDMVDLRKKLDRTKKGTDDYRDAAEALRKKQGQLNTAIDKAKPAADKAGKGFRGARTNALNLAQTVEDAGGTIADVTNAMLREFGVKPLSFKTRKRLGAVGHDVGITQDPAERAVGGMASPYGGSSADDHLLIDPYGRPVAAMSGTEGILNRPQMGIVDQALALTAAAGVQPYAGLGALWGSGLRHYETGGALARATQLDRMDLPYVWGGHHGDRIITDPRPGLDCSSTVSYVLNIPPRVSGAFENYGQPGEGPITIAANPTHVFMRIGGRYFGTSHENPGGGAGFHSPRSFAGFTVRHVSGEGIGGAGGEIPRVMIDGPAGALRSIAQGASDRMRRGANAYMTRQLGAMDNPAGQPLDEGTTVGGGAMSEAQARAVAAQALRMTGHYSAANVAGLVAMGRGESGLVPSRVQQIHDVNSGGNEARGWLQVTPGTFRANMMPGHGNIFDPLDNALASIRYQFRQYGHIVGHAGYSGGGLLGGLRRFAAGGALRRGQHRADVLEGGRSASKSYTELSRANATDADRYSALESRYGTTAPDLIYPDGSPREGQVNQRALSHRIAQIQNLVDIREATVKRMQEMRRVAAEVAERYHALVARLQRSLAHAKGKKRDGVRKQIKAGQAKERTWRGRVRQIGTKGTAGSDLYAAFTDLLSIRGELAEVAGTQPTATDPTDDTSAAGADTSTADTTTTTPEQAPPDPAEVARQALEQVAAFQAGRAALFGSYGANYRPGGAGALDTVGAQAAGTRYYGGDTGGADGGVLAGAGVTQNVYLMGPQPADPHTFTAATLHELKALV